MKAVPRVWVTALLVAASGCFFAEGASGSETPSHPSHDPSKKPPQYVVAEVCNTAGEIHLEAILNDDLTARKKECAATYREVMADWRKAMEEAKKNKEKFTEKKPVAPYVKKVSEYFRTEGEARAEAERLRKLAEAPKSDQPPADPKKGVEGKGETPTKTP